MALTPDMAVAKRVLRVQRKGGEWTINGETWDDVEKSGFTRCFANPQRVQVEQWTIVNESGGWFHPVHIHLIDGKIIGRNTNGGKPFAWEGGPKDVFYAGENESVTVADAVRHRQARGRPVHGPLPQPGARGPRHDGPVRGRRPRGTTTPSTPTSPSGKRGPKGTTHRSTRLAYPAGT